MSRAPIDLAKLTPADRESVERLIDSKDPDRVTAVVSPARSQAARTRKATGADFEAELDVTHTAYEFRRWGKIRRNYIPTKMIGKGRRVPCGVAHVDRSGWVRVTTAPPSVAMIEALYIPEAESHQHRSWIGCSRNEECFTQTHIIPTAFDAKVNGENVRRGWYFHDAKLQHQLHDLKAAADAGEYAFLLVLERRLGRAFGIPIQPHYVPLLSGRGVQMYQDEPYEARLPSIAKRGEELGWDWIPMLSQLAPR